MPNNKIDSMLITQISNGDALCLEIKQEKINYFAISMNLEIEEQIENIFTKLDQIIQIVKGARISIATGSNSRSQICHDKINNTRGKTWRNKWKPDISTK
ncbi:MAG: hypothetical protein FWC68_02560 [Oscillospiraceae bacterium]|nr:hypothetical protein [Oscillospiraceae bacterium]